MDQIEGVARTTMGVYLVIDDIGLIVPSGVDASRVGATRRLGVLRRVG